MVIDTNILILFSSGDSRATKALLESKETFVISRISYIEFLADRTLAVVERDRAREFLKKHFIIIDIEESIAEEAVQFRIATSLKLPDAIIAATALVRGEKLLTEDKIITRTIPQLVIGLD